MKLYLVVLFVLQRTETSNSIQALTKFVPRVEDMTREKVQAHIERSMNRMNVPKLDCLQFHWWDYGDKRYLEALKHLADLQSEGKIGTVCSWRNCNCV